MQSNASLARTLIADLARCGASPMRALAFAFVASFLLAALVVPPVGAEGASTTERHVGALSGSGLGLHVAKVVPWRATAPFTPAPGAARAVLALAGHDADQDADPSDELGMGLGWFVYAVAPSGEVVARSPTTKGSATLELDAATLRAQGPGEWLAVVECDFCVAMTYTLDVTVEVPAVAALVSLDDAHLLVVPARASEATLTVRNAGTQPLTVTIASEGLPVGWTLTTPGATYGAPGSSFSDEVKIEPPATAAPGASADVTLVAKDANGRALDAVVLHATYSPALAAAREHGHAVIAMVEFDTANPYHRDFRGDAALAGHPQYVLPAYPADAQALPLTLDAPTYADAMAADADTWSHAKANTLYYIPGTRFVGYISFGSAPHPDEGGHVTGTTSLSAGALGEAPDAYIVAVGGDFFAGLRWAARQPWIDAVSMSLGIWAGTPTVGVSEPVGAGSGTLYVPFSIPYGQKVAYESGKRVFTGTSQGWGAWVGTSDGTVPSASASGPCPYNWIGDFSGSPWTFAVETYWPWTELPWRTSCNPDVVAKGWDLNAASALSLDGHNDFGHTSGATPQAAGAYVRLVQEARELLGSEQVGATPTGLASLGDGILAVAHPHARLPQTGPLADGVLTVREAEATYLHGLEQVNVVQSYLRHGADARWTQDASPVLPGAEYAWEGYGLVTPTARAAMLATLAGDAPAPLRADDDAAYAASWAAREAFWAPQMADEVWVF